MQAPFEDIIQFEFARFSTFPASASRLLRTILAAALVWTGSIQNSPVANVKWDIVLVESTYETNSDDCGIHIISNAIAHVLQEPASTKVDGLRILMTEETMKIASGGSLG